MFDKLINRSLFFLALIIALFIVLVMAIPKPAYAQSTASTYVENFGSLNTKAAQGVTPVLGAVWQYAPPTGGYVNSTTITPIAPAAGAGIKNVTTGGECYAEALGAATEIVLMDGATVVWRMKVPVAGWTIPVDINFVPYIRGSANTALNFQGLTASVTGAIYCNWRGGTDK